MRALVSWKQVRDSKIFGATRLGKQKIGRKFGLALSLWNYEINGFPSPFSKP
jgi:hypothetical protein